MRARAILEQLTIDSVVEKYPIKNVSWEYGDGKFLADASSLGLMWKDPWNRPIDRSKVTQDKDSEGEVTAFNYTTSVEGVTISCVIFND